MASIEILSSDVVDQIAAGEVVERPAHMVKELVENSMDAGATEIILDFSEGGRFVKVSDNGEGIEEKSIAKALERFATSKIKLSADLWKLHTYGFRGEALASISAVSRLTLISKTKEAQHATQIVSEFGQRSGPEQIGGSTGTTVQIEDLFQNVPARLKFLKTAGAEAQQIKAVFKSLAMSAPHIQFKLLQDKELVLFYPKTKSKYERAKQVLEISDLNHTTYEKSYVKVEAVFASAEKTAKTSKQMWFYAQNRWIQDRTIQAAVMDAYRSLLMHGEYPICALWIETDPEQVDVNIHPTKSQVKFADTNLIFKSVQDTLRSYFERGTTYKPQSSLHFQVKEAPSSYSLFQKEFAPVQYQQKPTYNDYLKAYQPPPSPAQNNEPLFDPSDVQSPSELLVSPAQLEKKDWADLHVLSQANLTYIVCQSEKGLVMVDQHAAQERVYFEKLMAAWKSGQIDVQENLFPTMMDLSPEKVAALLTQKENLEKMGIHIEEMGPESVGVRAAPIFIKEAAVADALNLMANEIVDLGGSFSIEKKVSDIFASLACHSAIRAGQALSLDQMQSLLKSMDEHSMSSFCPHGRPVSVEYSWYKIEKDFGRIV